MIGSLAEIEKEFGYLWGQDIQEDDLTEKVIKMREKYLDLRTRILNNGNNQLRKAIADLGKNSGNIQYKYKFYNREDS